MTATLPTLLACLAAALAAVPAWAQTYPNKPVRIISPFSAGGPADVYARYLGQRLDKALGQPFLNWAGKAERLSFDVPTLPLFIHERLSTTAIINALRAHRWRDQHPHQRLYRAERSGRFQLLQRQRADAHRHRGARDRARLRDP